MDWQPYKARCNAPDVWSRWMLMQTVELLAGRDELIAPLRRALKGRPLAKPAGHKGGSATDMFPLTLNEAQADAILAAVRKAAQQGAQTSGTQGRGLGGFPEAWLEYRQFLAAPPQAGSRAS